MREDPVSDLGPLDHLARPALPWRAPHLAECGKPLDALGGRIVSRDELRRRVADIGQQRAVFTTCMTCWETADRWSDDGVTAVHREAKDMYRGHSSGWQEYSFRTEAERHQFGLRVARRDRFVAELEAIEALIGAHREEFEGYLAGRAETVSLAARRSARKAAGR